MSTPEERFLLLHRDDEPLNDDPGFGGDNAVGTAYSRRATWYDNHEQNYISVIVVAWVDAFTYPQGTEHERRNYDHGDDDELPNVHSSEYKEGTPGVEYFESAAAEFIRHTDPEDPGGTEVSADIEYEENGIGYLFQSTLADSEMYCRNWVNGIDFDRDFSLANLKG